MSKSDELRKQVQDLILKHRTFVNVYQTRNKDVWQMEDYGTVEEIAAHLVAAGFRDVHGADDLMDGDPYAMVQFKLPVDAPANSAPVASADAGAGDAAPAIPSDYMDGFDHPMSMIQAALTSAGVDLSHTAWSHLRYIEKMYREQETENGKLRAAINEHFDTVRKYEDRKTIYESARKLADAAARE